MTKKMWLLLYALAIINLLALEGMEAKRIKCRDKLHKGDQDFFYCTKFSVGLGRPIWAKYRARFTRSHESAV